MTFEQRLAAMQQAQVDAERAFVTELTSARDAYVLAGRAHIAAETAWLENPADTGLMDAAAGTWSALVTARGDLTTIVEQAATDRLASLTDAWNTIKVA
jgi:hypothetical protein